MNVPYSKSCQETLSRVFTIESLSEIPVLEEYFCNPLDINFEYYSGDFEKIAKRKEFRNGRTMWLWPRTEILKPIMKSKGLNIEGDDYSSNFRGYKWVQLNEYETDPYFLQLSQNMTSDCLFTFVFFPEFTCFAQKIVLFWCSEQFSAQNR